MHFDKTCRRYCCTALSKNAFAFLVKNLVKVNGMRDVPTKHDLEAAFVCADADENGTVDFEEFMHMYELVKRGKIKGLGGTNLSHTSAVQRARLAEKQLRFRESVQQHASKLRRLASVAKLRREAEEEAAAMTAADGGGGGGGNFENGGGGGGENGENGGGSLHVEKANTEGAYKLIKPYVKGHSYHSLVEKDQKWMEEERDHMSEELTKQNRVWLTRQEQQTLHTDGDELGHFAADTVANSHHQDTDHLRAGGRPVKRTSTMTA